MTGAPLNLDADGLDALTEQPPPDRLRALLAEAWERKSDVLVPAWCALRALTTRLRWNCGASPGNARRRCCFRRAPLEASSCQ
jgi:hypothetical protein